MPTIDKGVYVNYKDISNHKYIDLDNYLITKYKTKFCLLSNKTGRVDSGFYGFSDGVNFYLNLFKYSTEKVYYKTDLYGEYYFIDEIICDETIDWAGIKAMLFGALGTIIFPDNSEVSIPMLIHRVSGEPVFLTHAYMLDLLKSNKELLKEYKKSKRTPAEKKLIYKKFYNL